MTYMRPKLTTMDDPKLAQIVLVLLISKGVNYGRALSKELNRPPSTIVLQINKMKREGFIIEKKLKQKNITQYSVNMGKLVEEVIIRLKIGIHQNYENRMLIEKKISDTELMLADYETILFTCKTLKLKEMESKYNSLISKCKKAMLILKNPESFKKNQLLYDIIFLWLRYQYYYSLNVSKNLHSMLIQFIQEFAISGRLEGSIFKAKNITGDYITPPIELKGKERWEIRKYALNANKVMGDFLFCIDVLNELLDPLFHPFLIEMRNKGLIK